VPLRLSRVTYAELPGWTQTDPQAAFGAFKQSCAVIVRKDENAPMGGAGYAGVAKDWRAVCALAAEQSPGSEKAFFEQWFAPVAVRAGEAQTGLFTGYYEPEIAVSRTRHGAFQTPVYGVPTDLVNVDLGLFRADLHGEHIVGKAAGGTLVPYPTRAQIDASGVSAAPILFYAADPVALFFLHIQGSGRVQFEDGDVARIAYAAQNGHAYTAIGSVLLARGELAREEISLETIRAWLHSHPDAARKVMETDESFIFFKQEPLGDPKLGAKGAEGVPLTASASLAVDTHFHAFGVPFYVSIATPESPPLQGVFVAQDRGGAIRGAVRADIYFGHGAEAEARAGSMKWPGCFYALLPKPLADRLPAQLSAGAP
jgi:membrane-bound lytic murein transglycosylase A